MCTLRVAARGCFALFVLFGGLNACSPSTASTSTPDNLTLTSIVTSTESQATSTLEAAPTAQDVRTEIDTYLRGMTDLHAFSGSALVFQNGETLIREGYGFADRANGIPNTPETRYRIGHMTMGFTAVAILQLQAMGKLNVEDSVCAHLPDCPATWQPITIHHLLTTTSGLSDYATGSDFEKSMNTPTTPRELLARIQDKSLNLVPGETWVWTNSNYVVLGAVIEQVAGVPYETFVQDHILTPLKMTHTSFEQKPADLAIGYARGTKVVAEPFDVSVAYSAWGATSTVDDLLLWSQALKTEALIPAELIAVMFTPHTEIIGEPNWKYGYGWMVGEDFEHREAYQWANAPGFAAGLKHFPDEHVTIVLLSNQADVSAISLAHQIVTYLYGD